MATLKHVRELILKQPTVDKYQTLKQSIIDRLSDSAKTKLNRLLSGILWTTKRGTDVSETYGFRIQRFKLSVFIHRRYFDNIEHQKTHKIPRNCVKMNWRSWFGNQNQQVNFFLSPDKARFQVSVQTIASYPPPPHTKGLQKFLGMLNYYRIFLPHAAHKQSNLYDLLEGKEKKSNQAIVWTEKTTSDFEQFEKLLFRIYAINSS